MQLAYYNGAAWSQVQNAWYWDGAAWTRIIGMWYYDGSAWQKFFSQVTVVLVQDVFTHPVAAWPNENTTGTISTGVSPYTVACSYVSGLNAWSVNATIAFTTDVVVIIHYIGDGVTKGIGYYNIEVTDANGATGIPIDNRFAACLQLIAT